MRARRCLGKRGNTTHGWKAPWETEFKRHTRSALWRLVRTKSIWGGFYAFTESFRGSPRRGRATATVAWKPYFVESLVR